ncbi:hypothetical protein V2J09_006832 [Rumex salicifolius]
MEQSTMMLFNPITLIIPSLLFLFFLYKWRFTTFSSHGKNLPPSPPKLPIIGNLHQLSTSGPYRSLQKLSQKYGEIMLLHLGSKPTLVVSSKEMASQVLKTHESCFSERTKLAIAKSAFYNCKEIFFSPYGEQWRSLRSLCMLKLFSVKRVKSFSGVRKEEVALMIEKIKGSSVVNLSEMIFTLTNNLICKAAFGRKYSEGDGAGREFEELIGGVISVVGSNNIEDVLPWMGWINRFNGVNTKINRISKGFEDVIERIIQEQASRMKETTNQDSESDETSLQHFVDILLDVQRKNAAGAVPLDNVTIKGVIFRVRRFHLSQEVSSCSCSYSMAAQVESFNNFAKNVHISNIGLQASALGLSSRPQLYLDYSAELSSTDSASPPVQPPVADSPFVSTSDDNTAFAASDAPIRHSSRIGLQASALGLSSRPQLYLGFPWFIQ